MAGSIHPNLWQGVSRRGRNHFHFFNNIRCLDRTFAYPSNAEGWRRPADYILLNILLLKVRSYLFDRTIYSAKIVKICTGFCYIRPKHRILNLLVIKLHLVYFHEESNKNTSTQTISKFKYNSTKPNCWPLELEWKRDCTSWLLDFCNIM